MKSRNLSSGPAVSGHCLCGAVQFEMEYPAFWAWHDHSRASPLAHGAVYATCVGTWRKRFRTDRSKPIYQSFRQYLQTRAIHVEDIRTVQRIRARNS